MTDSSAATSDPPVSPKRHRPRWLLAILLVVTLVALGAAVDRGEFRAIDRWGYQHRVSQSRVLQPLTDPAGVSASALIACTALFRLRSRKKIGAIWLAAFAASLVIEIVGKATVETPFAAPNTLVGTSIHQGSFPSGHTMRAAALAGLLTTAWPRLRLVFVLWAAGTIVLIEVSAMHSTSEVLGGLLGGLALIAAASAAGGTRSEPSPSTPLIE
jgi:membrane-associated phospholipid phosphatase